MAGTDNESELTPEEQELLSKHLKFYRSLETGERKPSTTAQKHFVDVTLGRAGAETAHELTYAKYMRLRAQRKEAARRTAEEYAGNSPTEEWFSRADWYKLRARQRRDSGDGY